MAKKKANQNKIDEIKRREQKNKFLSQFRALVNLIAGQGIYDLIPSKELEKIYFSRARAMRIIPEEGSIVPDDVLEISKSLLRLYIQNQQIAAYVNGPTISIEEFSTTGYTLYIYSEMLNVNDYPNAHIVKKSLEPFNKNIAIEREVENHIIEINRTIAWCLSSFNSNLYLFNFKVQKELNGKPGYAFAVEIRSKKLPQSAVEIDNVSRNVIQIGWLLNPDSKEFEFVTLNLNGIDYQVFMQQHAIHKLQERIDCVIPGFLHFFAYLSLKNPTIQRKSKNELLIEYKLFDKKVGYFLGLIINDAIIIRTFLFLTNDGTPEGSKLNATIGLSKQDKKYLEIDKLSTYLFTDLKNDERLKTLLFNNDCKSLFELDDKLLIKPEDIELQPITKHISKYLGFDK